MIVASGLDGVDPCRLASGQDVDDAPGGVILGHLAAQLLGKVGIAAKGVSADDQARDSMGAKGDGGQLCHSVSPGRCGRAIGWSCERSGAFPS